MKLSSFTYVAVALFAVQVLGGCGTAEEEDIDAGYVEPAPMSLPDNEDDLETTQAALLNSVTCSSSTIKCEGKCYPKSRLPKGCQTCKTGYAFRSLKSGDNICIHSGQRVNHEYENAFHRDNVDPFCQANPSSCSYGKNQCKQGYVWRNCFSGDQICVTSTARNDCARENQQHRSNTVIWGR